MSDQPKVAIRDCTVDARSQLLRMKGCGEGTKISEEGICSTVHTFFLSTPFWLKRHKKAVLEFHSGAL